MRNSYIVIGAHYDHIGLTGFGALDPLFAYTVHPNADDNASGTVALLELARRFSALPMSRRVLFVHFSGEELGLLGSAAFVRQAPFPMDSIAAMFNFDMIGQLRDGRLDVLGIGSARDRQRVIDSTGILTGITQRRQVAMGIAGSGSGSDHMSFGLSGVPVLHFFARLHVAYHARRDTVERLNLAGMLSVIDVTERLIRVVGDDVVGDDVATTMRRVQR